MYSLSLSKSKNDQGGFTLVELLVVISLGIIMFTSFGIFFNGYLKLYTAYQADASNFTDLASQSQRISNVVRGIVDIVDPQSNQLTAYAYFSPGDTYTSLVKYYLGPGNKSLLVDVTPMTSNPPIGTPVTAQKVTYTIIPNYNKITGINLFDYFDSTDAQLTPPIANQHTIMSVRVNLAVPTKQTNKGFQMSTTVSLRNRKANL